MDNRLLNINGSGDEMLLKALELAFLQFSDNCTCSGWQQTKENGLILCWTDTPKDIDSLPCDLSAEDCLTFVKKWLATDFAKNVEFGEWCHDKDQDGDNSLGWQVYCEEWGRVGNQRYAICAIRPAYLWHGK